MNISHGVRRTALDLAQVRPIGVHDESSERKQRRHLLCSIFRRHEQDRGAISYEKQVFDRRRRNVPPFRAVDLDASRDGI